MSHDALFDVDLPTRPAKPAKPAVYPPDVVVERDARISDDGAYRYLLTRRWGDGPAASFVMHNPSTADANQDDPTIRRCVGFARSLGCAALYVVNLYAYRATDPDQLWMVDDPVGPENDARLATHIAGAAGSEWPLIGAWGAGARPDRVTAVMAMRGAAAMTALDVTKDGQPRHPLYLPATARPTPWSQP